MGIALRGSTSAAGTAEALPKRSAGAASKGLVASLAVVAAVGGVLPLSCRSEVGPRDELLDQGLPSDLYDHLSRLRALDLPTSIGEPVRLPADLEQLTVGELEAPAAGALPRGLEVLRVEGHASLDSLAPLPRSLDQIDLPLARLGSLEGSPPGLRSLRAGRIEDWAPRRLAGVEYLSLAGTAVRDLWELPPSVRALELTGNAVEGLEGAGPALRTIELRQTLVQSPSDLPANLEILVLDHNPLLDPIRFESLPSSLIELRLSGQRLESPPPEGSLSYLRSLVLRGVRLTGGLELDRLPRSLAELELESDVLDDLSGLPPDLLHLGLVGQRRHDLSGLPASLRSLRLETAPGTAAEPGGVVASVGTLQVAVERLALRYHGPPGPDPAAPPPLDALPPSVTELELSGVPLAASASWSPGLRSLHYWEAPAGALPALPETLEVIDLAGADLRLAGALEGLPALREVRLGDLSLAKLPALPDSVAILDIASTGIDSLEGQSWPSGLEELTVGQYQLEMLEGLPDSVRVLRITPGLPRPGWAGGGGEVR